MDSVDLEEVLLEGSWVVVLSDGSDIVILS